MAQIIDRQIPVKFQPLYQPYRYKVFHGGRGGAKSHSIADYLITSGLERRMRFLCTREIQKSLSTSVHQLLVDKIREHGVHEEQGGPYTVTKDGIRGPNHTHFMFAGLRTNPASVKSTEDLDGAWVEEADTVSQSSLDLLLPTVRKPGSEIIFSFNRRNKTDPVDTLFLGGTPPPNSAVVEVNWRDNPWFPKVLFDEMMWMKKRDRDKWLHVWEGHPLSRSEAKVFNNWEIDDLDDRVPAGCQLKYGADWGFAIDPTVLVGMYVWDRTIYIRHEAWKVGCHIDETPSLFAGTDTRDPRRWENTFGHRGLPNAIRNKIVADSARPETIAYMKARGFDVIKSIKGPGSIEDGIEFLQSYDIVVHPSCQHVIDEMTMYEYKTDAHTDAILAELADKHNHTIDAVRYALESLRRRMRATVVGAVDGSRFMPHVIEG